MKFTDVLEMSASLVGNVVVFNKRCETDYECDADVGMKGRVKNITMTPHNIAKIEIDLSEFEAHNDPLMQKNYYDREGRARLNMKEAGMYTGTESVYTEPNFELPFDMVEEENTETEYQIQYRYFDNDWNDRFRSAYPFTPEGLAEAKEVKEYLESHDPDKTTKYRIVKKTLEEMK